jgi:hypothetical protein
MRSDAEKQSVEAKAVEGVGTSHVVNESSVVHSICWGVLGCHFSLADRRFRPFVKGMITSGYEFRFERCARPP